MIIYENRIYLRFAYVDRGREEEELEINGCMDEKNNS